MTQKSMAAIAGLVLVVVGAVLGLWPSSIVAAGDTVSCGSPWSPDDSEARHADFGKSIGEALRGERASTGTGAQRCAEALGSRGLFGGILVGLGVVALIGAAVLQNREQVAAATSPPSEPPAS